MALRVKVLVIFIFKFCEFFSTFTCTGTIFNKVNSNKKMDPLGHFWVRLWVRVAGFDNQLVKFVLHSSCSCFVNSSLSCPECDKADIVFLVDSSKSIGLPNFRNIRSFVKAIIKGFDIGPNKVQFGLAQYSEAPHQEFLLKDHAGSESMLAAVEKMPWQRGKTNTGQALDFLRTNYFTKEAGSRAEQKVPQIALVITDGDSHDDVKRPAERLRKHGVTIFCIAVGNLLNKELLENITSLPPERFMLSVNTFQTLGKLNDLLLEKVCDSVENQRQGEAKD